MGAFGVIGVLMGGYSSERDISLKSGNGVVEALTGGGYRVKAIDIVSQDKKQIMSQIAGAGIDIAFIALHGRLGEDGVIQAILEEMNLPYTGCGVKASQIAFNKVLAQRAFKGAGLAVPPHFFVEDGQFVEFKKAWAQIKSTPLVVKAACEGSSIGVHVVRHPSEWEPAIKNALGFGPYVIVEKFIKGREVTAGVFDGQALPLVEICPKKGFFDFNAKYQKGMTDYVVPAQLDQALTKKIQAMAQKAYETIGAEGFARIDVRMDDQLKPYILEINTIPGFTPLSLFPKAASVAGYSFLAVCEKLLELAYAKKNKH